MKISLLTKQFSPLARFGKEVERRVNYHKYILQGDYYKAWTCTNSIGGHQDVVDSFVKGAGYFPDVELLINPSRYEAVGSVLYVSAGWRTLADAIVMKREHPAQKLIAGPVISDRPKEHGYIVADPAIDSYIVASQWYKDLFNSELSKTSYSMNIDVCPAGVDHNFWKPDCELPPNKFVNALVYGKGKGIAMLQDVVACLAGLSKNVKILKCKFHTPSEYKNALEWADFCVFCGETETQGLAFTQAWSMNRQTFVYRGSPKVVQYELAIYGKHDSLRSIAAPYLTPETGAFWGDIEELSNLINNILPLSPRLWVLDNQTNMVAFAKFLDIINKAGVD